MDTLSSAPIEFDAPAQKRGAASAMEQDHSALVARQAVLNPDRSIFGYELFNRAPMQGEHSVESDAALLFNVLTLTESHGRESGKPLLISCTHESLLGSHLELVHPEQVILKLPPVEGHVPDEIAARVPTMAALSQRGFRFAFDHTILSRNYTEWRPFVAFVRLDRTIIKPELMEPLVRYAREHTPAQLIATKIETEQQFAQARALGFNLFHGYWFSEPVLLSTQGVRPSQLMVLKLLELVQQEAEVDAIEDVLKKDPALAFTLLKYINSAGFGLSQPISSFRHAVMLLGLNKLLRWSVLLLTHTGPGSAPASVGATAVVRGRLMELLAQEAGQFTDADRDTAFIVGVFSLLDSLLGRSMTETVPTLHLPQSVQDALLDHSGPYAPLLDLTLACESADDEVFARKAIELGLSNRQVNGAHLAALVWADNLLG